MSGVIFGRRIFRLGTVNSTQDFLKDQFQQGADDGTVVLANEQTQGRGRQQRPWASAPGLGLWASFLAMPTGPEAHWGWVPLWAGIAVHRALAGILGPNAAEMLLKWPNDILWRGRKLGGILAEVVRGGGDRQGVVLGIGINLLQKPEDFPPELRNTAVSLHDVTGKEYEREMVLERLNLALDAIYPLLKPVDPGKIKESWLELAWAFGAKVEVLSSGERYTGRFTGLGEHGEFVIRPDSGDDILLASTDEIHIIEG